MPLSSSTARRNLDHGSVCVGFREWRQWFFLRCTLAQLRTEVASPSKYSGSWMMPGLLFLGKFCFGRNRLDRAAYPWVGIKSQQVKILQRQTRMLQHDQANFMIGVVCQSEKRRHRATLLHRQLHPRGLGQSS